MKQPAHNNWRIQAVVDKIFNDFNLLNRTDVCRMVADLIKILNDKNDLSDLPDRLEIFEKQLEGKFKLITEAISDVFLIRSLNDANTAIEIVKKHFIVIDRQDVEELKETNKK